jgi:hypothetical protein
MKKSYLSTTLQLRLLIGFLGERAQFAWWPTAFYEASSQLFLEPVFSKTFRLAQYHGVLEAARRLHDEHLNVGCYHLFRLPEELEQDLHGMLQNPDSEEFFSPLIKGKETSIDALTQLVATKPAGREGPTAVGRIQDITSIDVINKVASAYLWAFTQNSKTYPYLTV